MSIIQISKILQRSGDLVDLPQLDQAEFGFASDASRLFIGKTAGIPENVEILTAYSNISFSQIDGGYGNLNISNTVADGELLVYDGDNWVNRGGATGGLIDLGDVADIKIDGGGIGYVLTTDGTGNLSWSPKGVVVGNISSVSQANAGVVTTSEPFFLPNSSAITITDVIGMTELNGNSYFIGNVTSNTFKLYADITLSTPVNTEAYTTYVSGGKFVCATGGSEGSANAAGVTTSIQFNTNNLLDASANFTFNKNTNTLTLHSTNPSHPGDLIVNGNITANANISADTASFTTLNVTSGFPTLTVDTLTTTEITTGGVGIAGTITGNWTLTSGSRLEATYADLAEYYGADAHYIAGTVLDFGGEFEVTMAGIESNKIAGVVSADPAYVMNGMIKCEHPVAIALQGRVPCRVRGKVHKGDMMISAGDGFAKAATSEPKMGTVIGKALAKFDGEEGVIEVVVGRL